MMSHELQRLEIKLRKTFIGCKADCPGGCQQDRAGVCAVVKNEIGFIKKIYLDPPFDAGLDDDDEDHPARYRRDPDYFDPWPSDEQLERFKRGGR
jgi:hypothetical protein